MTVDVHTSIVIARARPQVASFAADPDNAFAWYRNIRSVEWMTDRPLAVGTTVAFVASFLGRELSYTYEVTEYEPGERLVQSTTAGPFPMQTTYTWEDTADGGTRMKLRNKGEPSGFSRMARPILVPAMSRANRGDLRRLKLLLESPRAA